MILMMHWEGAEVYICPTPRCETTPATIIEGRCYTQNMLETAAGHFVAEKENRQSGEISGGSTNGGEKVGGMS